MSSDRSEREDDPFHPPDIPIEVHCLHCGQEYESYLIEWREEMIDGRLSGRWCCPTPGCDGAGFGFDIFPTDPEWKDPTGELEISYDDGEDDEDGDDEDDGALLELDEDDDSEFNADGPVDPEEIDDTELEIEIEFVEGAFELGDDDDEEDAGPTTAGDTRDDDIPFD